MNLTSVSDFVPSWFWPLWANEQTRLGLIFVFAGLVVASVLNRGNSSKPRAQARVRDEDNDVPRASNTALWRRLWWCIRPPVDLMVVDGVSIDRGRKPHCLWLGPTGSGKSASVATVRVDGKRPTLVVTPDLSDPMIDACARLDGFRWTACQSGKPVNFLLGEPTEVAERLTEVFRSGGMGAWKRAARQATAQVIRMIDTSGEPRTLQLIGELLRQMVSQDRELKLVCAGWVARFLDLADQFGSSIESDGIDIADLLNQGMTVLLDNDAFDHPALGGDVVAFGLAEAKRCARLVPGGFRLIFEEAGQLGERVDLADAFFRAGRRRRICVDGLTQAESDLNEGISANTATRVYFAQELKSLQKVAADRLGLDYRRLDPANMRDFTAWLVHGKIRRLVRFPKPRQSPPSVADGVTSRERMGQTDGEQRMAKRYWVYEVPQYEPEPVVFDEMPALPPPSTVLTKILDSLYAQGNCERWGGKHDQEGHSRGCKPGCSQRHQHRIGCISGCAITEHVNGCYGLIWLDGRWQKVHRVRWELAYGAIPRNPDGTTQTIDHLRGVCTYKDCSKLTHLRLLPRADNSKDAWSYRGRVDRQAKAGESGEKGNVAGRGNSR